MFSIILSLFKAGGILQFFNNRETPTNKYYVVYAAAVIFLALLIVVLEVLELQNTIKIYEELMDHLIFSSVHVVTIFKTVLLCVNRKKVNRVMDAMIFEYEFLSSFGGEMERNIRKGVRTIRIVSTGYIYTILMMAIITIGMPLFGIIWMSPDEFTSGRTQCRKLLALYSLIPFPTSTKWFCVAGYIFQMVTIIVHVTHLMANDTFFVILVLHLKLDAEILQKVFATIRSRSLEKMKLPQEYGLLYDCGYPELENVVNKEMREATMSLQKLLRISDDIESIFQYIAFVQIIFSLSNLMCCLFVGANMQGYTTEFFVQVQVYLGISTQLSIYCIFAHNASIALSEIPWAVYQDSWFAASKSFKGMMMMNILRMNKPVVFTAAKFVALTLPLLVRILRMSYSFYTVLRK